MVLPVQNQPVLPAATSAFVMKTPAIDALTRRLASQVVYQIFP